MSSSSGSDGHLSVGQKAREMRKRVVDFKSQKLFSQFIEPAVYQAAENGLGHCTLVLEEDQYKWLLTASGGNSVFVEIVEKNGLHVHSFERGPLKKDGPSAFFIVLSWEDEDATPPPVAPRPNPPSQIKSEPPAPLPRNHPGAQQTKPQPQPRQQNLEAATEFSPAIRPFIGTYVQYPPTLHSVCKTGDIHTLRQLLTYDVEINGPDSFGYTPLHHAVSSGFADHAEVLIQHGADVLAGGMKHLTPLHCAAYMGRVDLVKVLAPVTNVNKLDITAKTPLHWAAERGYQMVCRELLAHGARVNIEDQFGMTPLKYAKFWNFKVIIDMISERAKEEEEEEFDEEEIVEEDECFAPVKKGELEEEGLLEDKGKTPANDLDDVE